ncbi:hypothetical protein SMMN14_05737 [Sphaerulina musiva]
MDDYVTMARYHLEDHVSIVPRQAEAGAATTPGLTSTTIVGVGVGIGSFLIVGFIILGLFFVRKRNAHKRKMAELEYGASMPASLREDMRQIARPASAASCSRFTQGGWGQLGSNETVQSLTNTCGKRKRLSVSLPKRIKHKSVMALKPWTRKHLSVIAESPRSTSMPRESSLPIFEQMNTTSPTARGTNSAHISAPAPALESPRSNVAPSFAIRSSGPHGSGIDNGDAKKPTLVARSVSMGVLTDDGAVFGDSLPRPPNTSNRRRPDLHVRSVSLGAPGSRPPSGPVPPLPVTSPNDNLSKEDRLRQAVSVSRMSYSSSDSASSSVLIASPISERRDAEEPLQSPRVEESLEDNDDAELRTIANRQCQNPRISGLRPTANMRVQKSRTSVRTRLVRPSTESALTQHVRNEWSSNSGSLKIKENRLSIPQICSAEAVSLSRVSSSNSLLGPGGITKITTPARRDSSSNAIFGSTSTTMHSTPTKRAKRVISVSSVSVYGSPSERRRASVLHEVSGNAATSKHSTPARSPSDSTLISCSSSNGNPFHWDSGSEPTMGSHKPSALKGSPNARKGHRRRNCVRISTLTPQVLGPPASQRRSRSVSPATLLQGVLEERESDEMQRPRTEPLITPTEERQSFLLACGSRAPKAHALDARNLRVQTLRASLTPSSPTLSTWTVYQQEHPERPLPSTRQTSNDSMNSESLTMERSPSRMSGGSFHIPKFPSPAGKSRASVSPIQCDTAPRAEFVGISPIDTLSPLENISPTDYRTSSQSSSPFALDMSSEEPTPVADVAIPSSPPMPISKSDEYDPAWPHVIESPHVSHRVAGGEEYDPASPPFETQGEQEAEQLRRSSFFLPFVMGGLDLMVDQVSPTSPAAEHVDSPPCSPKTIASRPFDLPGATERPAIPEKNSKRATVKLTSENASAMMASQSVNFPGSNVPILLPPQPADDDDDYCPLPRWEPDTSYEHITMDDDEGNCDTMPRPTLARPPSLSTIVQESSSPPPLPQSLHIDSSAKAPRERLTSPLGPRAPPAKSVLRNVTELRRMNSEVKVHRSRASRNYTRLGREASPLLPWIPTSPEAGEGQAIHREESSNSLFDFDFDSTNAGAEHQPGSAMDEIDFESLSIDIQGALAGFDDKYRYSQALNSSPPLQARRRGSDKENQDQENQQYQKQQQKQQQQKPQRPIMTQQRHSSVWDDGEKYWQQEDHNQQQQQRANDSRPTTAGSSEKSFTPHYIVSSSSNSTTTTTRPPARDSLARSSFYPDYDDDHHENEDEDDHNNNNKLLTRRDPRLLSTPAAAGGRVVGGERKPDVIVMAATPKSLYDADGFLRS